MEHNTNYETFGIIESIDEISSMLKTEERLWDNTDRSKTVDNIQKYRVFFYLLRNLVEEKSFDACMVALGKYQVSLDELKKCFYRKKGAEHKRTVAAVLFNNICNIIHAKYNK